MVIMDFLQPSLFMCQWRPIITSIGDCDHSDDVGVICYSNIAVEVKCLNGLENIYILDGILPNMGRVEVCGSDGQLHSICDDRYWSDPDATVICRQLGYTGIGYAVSGSYFSPNHRSPLFTKSICSGYETNYRDCPRVPADGSCQVIPNAGIVCYNGGSTACNDGEVMLTSSMNVSENLIELVMICFGGVWGHVCPNVWSEANAVVICRQNLLPYGWVQAKPIDISYETSDDILWLSDVQCSGSESRLVDCSRSILGIKRANCSLMGFAGVTCGREAPCVNGAFRLVPESSQVQSSVDRGRLETCVDTMWLTVCQEMFDITAGGIICNKIGFNNHSPTILTISDISPGLGHIAIITSNCTSPAGSSTCDIIVTVDEANVCSHINDIGLDCSTTTIESNYYIYRKLFLFRPTMAGL
jgi:deleted-in-malignant-brain-tumors protein 1